MKSENSERDGVSATKKQFSLKLLFLALTVFAVGMGLTWRKYQQWLEYDYTGTIEIKEDFDKTIVPMVEKDELPWSEVHDGVGINFTMYKWRAGEQATNAMAFYVSGDGFTHAKRLHALRSQMDKFIEDHPQLELGRRRITVSSQHGYRVVETEY